jgi:hypothetical protein
MRFAGMHFLDDVKETARANQSDNADLLRLNKEGVRRSPPKKHAFSRRYCNTWSST